MFTGTIILASLLTIAIIDILFILEISLCYQKFCHENTRYRGT